LSRESDFWSRRKAKVLEEQQAQAREEELRAAAKHDADLEEKSDEEVLDELNLPDPDTLEPGDDFKVFMAKAVPDRIRRRALRRLWLSNPALANLDGLLDYGEDFTDSATVVENLQTAYQVGKGMLKHVEELARQAEADEAEARAEKEAPAKVEDNNGAADAMAEMASDDAEDATAQTYQYVYEDDEDAQEVTPRRRMRFSFDAGEGART
jgi:hypothetical protein